MEALVQKEAVDYFGPDAASDVIVSFDNENGFSCFVQTSRAGESGYTGSHNYNWLHWYGCFLKLQITTSIFRDLLEDRYMIINWIELT